jgi:hypothetical protein
MTTPRANPSSFRSGAAVTFSFKARSTSGSSTLKVVYAATTITLDGKKTPTKGHPLSAANKTIADRFIVAGPPGLRRVRIRCSDGKMTQAFTVVLDIQP